MIKKVKFNDDWNAEASRSNFCKLWMPQVWQRSHTIQVEKNQFSPNSTKIFSNIQKSQEGNNQLLSVPVTTASRFRSLWWTFDPIRNKHYFSISQSTKIFLSVSLIVRKSEGIINENKFGRLKSDIEKSSNVNVKEMDLKFIPSFKRPLYPLSRGVKLLKRTIKRDFKSFKLIFKMWVSSTKQMHLFFWIFPIFLI